METSSKQVIASGLPSRTCAPARCRASHSTADGRSEEHTSELQSLTNLVCRLLLEKKKKKYRQIDHKCEVDTPFNMVVCIHVEELMYLYSCVEHECYSPSQAEQIVVQYF